MSDHVDTNVQTYTPNQTADNEHDSSIADEGASATNEAKTSDQPKEIGGRKGPDPTRFGDWEKNGRCIDF